MVVLEASVFVSCIVIPSLRAPGNDIDVYLECLVDELIQLWELGVEMYDISNDETFFLHGAIVFNLKLRYYIPFYYLIIARNKLLIYYFNIVLFIL